jgi:hypothetical protein
MSSIVAYSLPRDVFTDPLPSNGSVRHSIIPSTPKCSTFFLPFRFFDQNCVGSSHLSVRDTCTRLSHPDFIRVRRGADKSLAFPICSITKIIFLGWVKEVRTTKS